MMARKPPSGRRRRARPRRFNGAAPMMARKQVDAQVDRVYFAPGFNGAAPMMARKLAAAHETAIAQNEASMEPRQ